MTKLFLRLPWFLSAPLVVVVGVVFAVLAYQFTGDYFNETCKNERNPLTGQFEASNCGEGAKVARQQSGAQTPGAGGSSGGGQTPAGGSAQGAILAKGTFRDGDPGHTGKGEAEVQRLPDGKLNLFLRDFSVTNGPDLFVYLTEDPEGRASRGGLNLGKLQANNGNQNYAIPAGTEIGRYKSVAIWCKQFNVDFAIATLSHTQASAGGGSTQASATATASPTTGAQTAAQPSPTAAATSSSGGQAAAQPTPTAPPAPTATSTVAAPKTGVLSQGQFRDGDPGHDGSGTAQVQRLADGKLNLFLSNFSVTNGPDLVVVLSTDPAGSRGSVGGGLQLGKLKANNGNQNYAIPDGTDTSKYRSVIIWCKSFPTVFAYATLEATP